MDTIRVDICDRPLRIAWAIRSGDIEAYRRAVGLSFALWEDALTPFSLRIEKRKPSGSWISFASMWFRPSATAMRSRRCPRNSPLSSIHSFTTRSLWRPPLKNGSAHKFPDVYNPLVHFADRREWKARLGALSTLHAALPETQLRLPAAPGRRAPALRQAPARAPLDQADGRHVRPVAARWRSRPGRPARRGGKW